MTRVIFHVDLDAFFVAVERVLDPTLIGKPVVVGGASMPVRKLPGLGPKAEAVLGALGIRTLGDLAAHPVGPIARRLGEGQANWLKERATGHDDSSVVPERDAKSISAETTFEEDSNDQDFLHATMLRLAERVGARLRKSGRLARSVTIKLRYYDFSTISRQMTLPRAIDGDEAIYMAAKALLDAAIRARKARVRLLGVGVDELRDHTAQLALIESPSDHDSKLSSAVDRIRERFGRDAIKRAAVLRIS